MTGAAGASDIGGTNWWWILEDELDEPVSACQTWGLRKKRMAASKTRFLIAGKLRCITSPWPHVVSKPSHNNQRCYDCLSHMFWYIKSVSQENRGGVLCLALVQDERDLRGECEHYWDKGLIALQAPIGPCRSCAVATRPRRGVAQDARPPKGPSPSSCATAPVGCQWKIAHVLHQSRKNSPCGPSRASGSWRIT